jgi:hypothetical protein
MPVGVKFSLSFQTAPGTHPASYTMGTGSFPGVKRPGRDVDHTPSSSAEAKERVELYFYSPLGLRGLLYFYSSIERVELFKDLGTTLMCQNSIQEETKSILKSGNASYHLALNL